MVITQFIQVMYQLKYELDIILKTDDDGIWRSPCILTLF